MAVRRRGGEPKCRWGGGEQGEDRREEERVCMRESETMKGRGELEK